MKTSKQFFVDRTRLCRALTNEMSRVFISICILTLANALLLSASAEEIKLKLVPEKADLLVNKWPVNFTCTLSNNASELSSANLSFLLVVHKKQGGFDRFPIPDSCTADINSTALALNQCEHVAWYASGVYIQCRLKHNTSVKSPSSEVNIRLAHPQPEIPVSEAEVYNWVNLTFIANIGENRTSMYAMNYSAWVRKDSENSVYQRAHVDTLDSTRFLKATVENPYSFLTEDLIVKVNGTVSQIGDTSRIIETVSSQEVRLTLDHFVKPAPVSGIRTHQNDSSKLTISFEAPRLGRNITYNIVIGCSSKTPYNYTENATRQLEGPDLNHESHGSNHSNDMEQYRLHHTVFATLPPVSNCTASVRAISTAGGRWSEWTNSRSFVTVEGVPLRNPDVCSSCFSVQRTTSRSPFAVTVYFDPLSDETAQGKVIAYRIRVFERGASDESVHYLDNTEVLHRSFHLSNLSSGTDYEIVLEAATSRGYNRSLEKSTLIRFSPENAGSFRSHVIELTVTFLNYTTARINWALNDYRCTTERKTFLFWCKGNSQTKICSDLLNSKNISSDLRSDVIVFTRDESIFGIGFECDGKSSGILWNDCVYDINAVPAEPSVESVQTFESSASVLLDHASKECPASGKVRALAAFYRVSYCRIIRNESGFDSECLGAVSTSVHNRSPGGGALVFLDGLGHGQTYRLSVQSVSETNLSSGTVTKVFSTKYREPIGAVTVFLIVAGVLLVVLIVVILTGCRIYVVSGQSEIHVVVKSSVKKVTPVDFTRSDSYDDFAVTPRNYDVTPDGGCEETDEQPTLPGRKGDLGIDLGFSDVRGAERCRTPLQPGVAPVSSNPVDRSYCRVRPDSGLSFPVQISDSPHVRKFPFEEDDTAGNSVSRILPIVGGSLGLLEKDQSNGEDSLQKTELKCQEHSKGSQSASDYSSSSCCSSETQDYHCCVTVKSAETEKPGAAAAAAAGGGGDHDDAGDSGCGYVDGSARVVTVIRPPPSEPPHSLVRDHGGRVFVDPYRLSVSSDGGDDDDDDDGGGSAEATDYLEDSNPSDFSGNISSESQVQSKTAATEDDVISLVDSSLEQWNGAKTTEIRRDVYPDPILCRLDQVAADSSVSLTPILPFCAAPVTAAGCSGSQLSVFGSPASSLCDARGANSLASNEEDSETDLSCLDESIEYRSDQLFTRPVDSELKFTSESSILPPILST